MSLPKLHEPSPLNAIPQPLDVNLLLIEFITNLTVPNKQLFRVKLLLGLRSQLFNSETMYEFEMNLLDIEQELFLQ